MNKKELKKLLKGDRENYKCRNKLIDIYYYITFNQLKFFKKIIIISRKFRYYRDKKGIIAFLGETYYHLRFNLISRKSHINIQAKFGKNLKIYHENIIANQFAVIGDNVVLHGNNCIGNNGSDLTKCPRIGNNVDVGYGATIIGDIDIADDIKIGANSLVNKSFTERGIVIAGVPAKKIK